MTEIAGVIIPSPMIIAPPITTTQKPIGTHRHAEDARRLGPRQQREDSAFAIVVDAHEHRDVLNAHDEKERPDQQRHDAERISASEWHARS